MSVVIRLLTTLFFGFIIISCSGTKVSDSWTSQTYQGKIQNAYIIGIATNDLRRMMFENTFIRRLADEGVKSTPSFPDLPKGMEAEKESIIRMMNLNNSDSVLLTRVIGQDTKASFTSRSRTAMRYSYDEGGGVSGKQVNELSGLPYYINWHSYYNAGYQAIPAQKSVTNLVVLTIESVLYDLQTEELIWSARMETGLESDLEGMMKKFVDQAVKDLKKNGII